ncbi:Cysteine-rich receptor-like protein kinase 10 [Cardamine amara subsp. amara]|uniref:Cysteine-rich receptor-like protein kinase 10 n=1 Tax=Cardamine amara subsp. amara TaxID=228776 RepID=A0ABD1A442_CARAN
MSSCASFIFLFLFSFLTSFRASAQAQDPTYVYHICPNATTYSRNTTYFTNLQTLLSSLSSPNASYSTGFQTATAGQAPDRVTGLFLCRGDVSPEVCRSCVNFAVNNTFNRCRNEREVVIYYDECMLRYSNRNILSTLSTDGGVVLWNTQNVTSNQKDQFRDLVLSTMNQAAIDAANSSRKFDARKANFTALQNLYGLVQCTPDLTRQDCLRCLQQSINQLPTDKIGGRFIVHSCSSRYELYSFYNESAITLPPPPPPPVSTSPLSAPSPPGKSGNSTVLVVAIGVPIIVAVLLFIAGYCFLAKRAKKTYHTASAFEGDDITTADSLQLEYRTIQTATNDFAEGNKIGQGGFGAVYKGTLSDGTEVAVKRLSKSSGQGETEFKTEVVLVAKLQHRNLVRLLGFSIEGEERVLVYEYVPNESLDYFLFDPAKQGQLDWTRRYKIIGGIARGILYLHQDSRLTIIHRDLKASNILLDADMNPKVADFGMARIFGLDQTQQNTSRIVGTYGYMSPEYAMHGQYSMKSDVYSFGVLLLEIISGKKNSSFYQTDGAHDLVSYAWTLWSTGTPLEVVDPAIVDNCQRSEVIRCVHIGLLCVQEDAAERPTMSNIVLMLTSNTVTLPVPRQPGLFFQSRVGKDPLDTDQSSTTSKSLIGSVDGASITDVYPR